MKNIAPIISSTMVNLDAFGQYKIDNLFLIIEYFLNNNNLCTSNNLLEIRKAMIQSLEQSINNSNREKQIDVQCSVVVKPCGDSNHPKIILEPPIWGRPKKRKLLHQVASNTYGISFSTKRTSLTVANSYKTKKTDIIYKGNNSENTQTVQVGYAFVVLKQGQPIPYQGFSKEFFIHYKNADIYPVVQTSKIKRIAYE